MATYHYDYHQLDEFLEKTYGPSEIGQQLDETMSDLVHYAGKEEDYVAELPDRYYLIRRLRDIFLSLKKSE